MERTYKCKGRKAYLRHGHFAPQSPPSCRRWPQGSSPARMTHRYRMQSCSVAPIQPLISGFTPQSGVHSPTQRVGHAFQTKGACQHVGVHMNSASLTVPNSRRGRATLSGPSHCKALYSDFRERLAEPQAGLKFWRTAGPKTSPSSYAELNV